MSELNYLEFEYSLVIGEACSKLNKYIFTEELEDFFYAKRVSIEQGVDLEEASSNVRLLRKNLIKSINRISDYLQTIEETQLQRLFEL